MRGFFNITRIAFQSTQKSLLKGSNIQQLAKQVKYNFSKTQQSAMMKAIMNDVNQNMRLVTTMNGLRISNLYDYYAGLISLEDCNESEEDKICKIACQIENLLRLDSS
eukprot:TRINITY_DN468_c0_g1_i2.p3 TRINITY_DN468_c0_g1~~TRINITY_DN468_c0_g1_i2.p3  ORF type:complete len:108 (-),score=16.19 TRINITY_DN468_c0_g1_i2:261-584(-)